jgi:hypothetical protein
VVGTPEEKVGGGGWVCNCSRVYFSLLETESPALIDMRIDFPCVDDDEWLNKSTNSTMLLQPLDGGAQQVGY